MILHLIPKLFCPWQDVALLDLQIKSLGLHLKGGIDLVTRRPYPNKRVTVACRKQGQKAIEGILIDTKVAIDVAECVTRWTIADAGIVTHHVRYEILDHDFDVASSEMGMWSATSEGLGDWESRYPDWAKDVAPCDGEPMMAVIPEKKTRPMCPTKDALDKNGKWIIHRHQIYRMPTVQPERLFGERNCLNERFPLLESAFTCPVEAIAGGER